MTSYVTPKKNTEFIFYVGLFSQANTKVLQSNPTLASGDVRVSIDGGSFANLATLPTVTPASGKAVKITLSASEMNGDNITVLCSDAAGDEWCDLVVNIQTSSRQVDDLAYPATSGRSIVVAATGEVDANLVTWQGDTPNSLISGRVDVNVGTNIVEDARVGGAITQGGQTTTFTTNLSETGDDKYVGWRFVYTGVGANSAVTRVVEAYNGTTKAITLNRALPANATLGHSFVLWSDEVMTQAGANAAADMALADYDAPTKAELDTAQASIEADIAAMQGDVTDILADTGTTIPAQIGALNNLSAAQVNSEVDTALSDIHLDHLFATDYDPADKPGVSTALLNELIESDSGVSRYTANALENAPSGGSGGATAAQVWAYGNRTLTSAVTAVETTVSSTEVSMYRGDTFNASMTGLGALGTWTKVYLTVKRDDARDNDALLQLRVTNPAAAGDGLQRLNGRVTTAAWGSLTIDDDSAGDVTITLDANATKALEPGDYLFDIKYINNTGSHIKASGTWIVNQDITRAIS